MVQKGVRGHINVFVSGKTGQSLMQQQQIAVSRDFICWVKFAGELVRVWLQCRRCYRLIGIELRDLLVTPLNATCSRQI